MADKVTLEVDGPVAIITNNRPEKRNAFDDEMDVLLFGILSELKARKDVRCVIWRAEGAIWSAGRDTSVIGHNSSGLSHHELMTRGHRGILQVFELDAPVIVAIQGWAIGGSFQRALLCDIRIAAEGSRFRLPELSYGVIPDTGGMGRLYEICGTGLASDLILTGRTMDATEALTHGIVSRVVPADLLDETAREMAERIAQAPPVAVEMARRVLQRLSEPTVRSSMGDELIYQTYISQSPEFADFKAARRDRRTPGEDIG